MQHPHTRHSADRSPSSTTNIMARRPSTQTIAMLTAFAADPSDRRYGYELGQEVGLKAGSLYPILIRLTDRGLLDAT